MNNKLLSIKEIVEPIIGGYWGETAESGEGNARIVRNGDILVTGEIGPKVPERKLSEKEISKAQLRKGDILITMSGNVGRVARVRNDKDAQGKPYVASNFVKILRTKEGVLPEYLFFFLRGPSFLNEAKKFTRGVAIQNLSVKIFEQNLISKIPLQEQKRIVTLLEEADELKRKRTEVSQKMVNVMPTLFNQMFGDVSDWRQSVIEDLSEKIVDCPHSTPKYAQSETEYACVRSSDIQNGAFDWSTTKYVNEDEYQNRIARLKPDIGDIVLCREGARLGNAAIISTHEKTICLGQRMMLLRADLSQITPEYLHSFLLSNETQKKIWDLAGGAASPHLNVGAVKKLVVPVPPLNLQKEFSEKVKEIFELKEKQKKSEVKIDTLFSSLLALSFDSSYEKTA